MMRYLMPLAVVILVSIQKSKISGWSGQPSAVSDQLKELFPWGFC
jgi:hypothetical protein